jgi:hypothetical protein
MFKSYIKGCMEKLASQQGLLFHQSAWPHDRYDLYHTHISVGTG